LAEKYVTGFRASRIACLQQKILLRDEFFISKTFTNWPETVQLQEDWVESKTTRWLQTSSYFRLHCLPAGSDHGMQAEANVDATTSTLLDSCVSRAAALPLLPKTVTGRTRESF